MKQILAILFLVISVTAISQRTKENNPGKTETVPTTTGNPNSSGQINLISPADGKIFEANEISQPILFRWAPVVPRPQTPVTYRLRVWQLMQGQNATQAMSSNQPIVTKEVSNITQASVAMPIGPCKPPYLCDFIWSVEALNSNDKGSGKNYGRSGVFTFKANEKKLNAKNQGDPVHGVDVKLGFETKSKCDPILGVDIKLGIIARNSQGDPVHGVDVKLGAITAKNSNGSSIPGVDVKSGTVTKNLNAQGDPVHGVDVKLGAIARSQGDPVHGVDVKLGFEGKQADLDQIQSVDLVVTVNATDANGDPAHGVDVKLGAVAKNIKGDPVHGVDVKLGLRNAAQGDPVHGVDVKLGAALKDATVDGPPHSFPEYMKPHAMNLPIEKIVYDAAGNIIEIILRTKEGSPVPKVVVAGSNSISGEENTPKKKCRTVYCHNPLHPPGCGWQECN